MCVEAVNTCPFVFDSIPGWCKTKKICVKVVSKDPFMLKYCLDRYKTPELYDKTIDSFFRH